MDVRGQRTEQTVAACFLDLLEKKPVSQITVTELCQGARINRATFYKHFPDVFHLQDSLETKVLDELGTYLREHAFSSAGKYSAMMTELLSYAKRFGHDFYILCSPNAISDLPARVFELVYSLAFPILKERNPALSDEKAKLLYQYVSSGSGNILRSWLTGECSMTEEELADFIMQISAAAVTAAAERG